MSKWTTLLLEGDAQRVITEDAKDEATGTARALKETGLMVVVDETYEVL